MTQAAAHLGRKPRQRLPVGLLALFRALGIGSSLDGQMSVECNPLLGSVSRRRSGRQGDSG